MIEFFNSSSIILIANHFPEVLSPLNPPRGTLKSVSSQGAFMGWGLNIHYSYFSDCAGLTLAALSIR